MQLGSGLFGNERARVWELKFQRAISQRPKADRGSYVNWLDIPVKIFGDTSSGSTGIVLKDIRDAADSAMKKEEREERLGMLREREREDRVIYCKQYYWRHAEGTEEWEKPVSLVPEMYFIATEDGGVSRNGDPAYCSLSGRHWI